MRETLVRLAEAMSPEDVQLYYQIALAGRRDLPMAPDPRLGFEMTLLRMLAFRPDAAAAAGRPGRPAAASQRARAMRRAGVPLPRREIGAGRRHREHAPSAAATGAATRAAAPAIDAVHWPSVVEAAGFSGMVRQIALNCVPASFDNGALVLRLDEAADAQALAPHRGETRAGAVQVPGPRYSRSSSRYRRRPRHPRDGSAAIADQDRSLAGGGRLRAGSRRQGTAGALRRRSRQRFGEADEPLAHKIREAV